MNNPDEPESLYPEFTLIQVFSKLWLIFVLIFFMNFDTLAQREKIETYYKNGHLESKGFIYTYSVYNNIRSLPKKFRLFGEIKKKEGEWKYWYQNGQLSRIENYKLVEDRNPNDLPDGRWTYFNEQGIKYREDTYLDGTLISSTKEIYKDSQLAGKITIRNGIPDTSLLIPFSTGNNLILNSGFDYFYYKPVQVVYNGQTQIEDWIPFWVTPCMVTPDYISNLRYIDKLNYNWLLDSRLPEKYTYAGIALYKEAENYSEYIQGSLREPLIKGRKYCLKTSIALSSYSRFTSNRLAFNFSSSRVTITKENEVTLSTPVLFTDLPVETVDFTTLCDFFIAEGGEQFITVGRFSQPDKLIIGRRENIPQSSFGLEKSAYYLIDEIDLFEIGDTSECFCKATGAIKDTNRLIAVNDNIVFETDLNRLKQGNVVILENVNFEFDSYRLMPEAESVLQTLLNYLYDNPEIRIRIAGHTDDTGTEQYNLDLSINRAKSVYNWLIEKGIASTRLEYTGFGKSLPLYKESDEKCRELNRRVEIKIIGE